MDDLNKYISKRKSKSKTFAQPFELGYKAFKIGAILKLAREDSGMTQDEVARSTDFLECLGEVALGQAAFAYRRTKTAKR